MCRLLPSQARIDRNTPFKSADEFRSQASQFEALIKY